MLEYPKTCASIAFVCGVLLTLGFKDFYPDLEYRFRKRRQEFHARVSRSGLDNGVALEEDASPTEVSSNPTLGLNGIEGCIGNTPLIRIKSLSEATGCDILAKAEFLNGAGNSPKDRVALSIIDHAEKDGLLTPHADNVIYEGTVGSTGISLAAICRARGYLAHIVMPSDQSAEKSDLLLKLGARVERVTPAPIVDPQQFVNLARRRAEEHSADPNRPGRGFFADQFENPANYQAHYRGTGPEIWAQTSGKLDAFVAGAGTGGTISGVALFLRSQQSKTRIVLADPQGSGLYNKVKFGVMYNQSEKEGTRRRQQVDSIVEGIGVNRLTHNFEAGMHEIDDAVRVTDSQAVEMARWLVQRDGLFVGSSSAVNCFAAVRVAQGLGPGHTIVTILCDAGTRHLSKFWKQAGSVGSATPVAAPVDSIIDVSNIEVISNVKNALWRREQRGFEAGE